MPISDEPFRADLRNGGEDNRPRPLPPVDQLFTVVMWLREYGWCTVAWAMTRGDADDIAAMYLTMPHYTRSEVWHRGDLLVAVEDGWRAERDPALPPARQPEWMPALAERARGMAADLNDRGHDVCGVCPAGHDKAEPDTRPRSAFRNELDALMERYDDLWPANTDFGIDQVRQYAAYMRRSAADPEWSNLAAADREKNLAQATEMEALADRHATSSAPSLPEANRG